MLNFYLGQLVLDQFLLFEVGSNGSDIMEVTSFCSGFFHFFLPFDDPSETVALSFPLFSQNFSKKNYSWLVILISTITESLDRCLEI